MRRDRDINGKPVIVLSKRNILSLLHKVDMVGSQRTLIAPNNEFVVVVEDDDKHYTSDREVPGPMHPSTEAFIEGYGKKTL